MSLLGNKKREITNLLFFAENKKLYHKNKNIFHKDKNIFLQKYKTFS